jgi:hypothetical protein
MTAIAGRVYMPAELGLEHALLVDTDGEQHQVNYFTHRNPNLTLPDQLRAALPPGWYMEIDGHRVGFG